MRRLHAPGTGTSPRRTPRYRHRSPGVEGHVPGDGGDGSAVGIGPLSAPKQNPGISRGFFFPTKSLIYWRAAPGDDDSYVYAIAL